MGAKFDLNQVPGETFCSCLKAALYTVVPRCPFFAFCTAKYFTLKNIFFLHSKIKSYCVWGTLNHTTSPCSCMYITCSIHGTKLCVVLCWC